MTDIKIESEISFIPPELTAELTIRAFETLSKSRQGRLNPLPERDQEIIWNEEDHLYRALLIRIRQLAVTVGFIQKTANEDPA